MTNNPLDVAKTRLQAQRETGNARKYTSMVQTIWTVLKEEGARALFKGVGMRIARVAPGMGITFTCVERWTNFWSNRNYNLTSNDGRFD